MSTYGVASCWTCQKPGYPGAKFFSRTECMDCANERGRREAVSGEWNGAELENECRRAGGGIYAKDSTDYGGTDGNDSDRET